VNWEKLPTEHDHFLFILLWNVKTAVFKAVVMLSFYQMEKTMVVFSLYQLQKAMLMLNIAYLS